MRALEDEDAWRRIVATYDFDYIVFVQMNHEEGQFVIRRIQDPDWAAVLAVPMLFWFVESRSLRT